MERSDILKSADKIGYVKQVVSPNGEKLKIFSSNDNYYFQLNGFAKAVGYAQFNTNTNNLSAALDVKNSDVCLYYGFNKAAAVGQDKTYLINFADVEKVLNRLIKIVNSVTTNNFQQEQKKS